MIDNKTKSRYLINVKIMIIVLKCSDHGGAHYVQVPTVKFFVIDETLLTFRSNFLHNKKNTFMITATDIHIFYR